MSRPSEDDTLVDIALSDKSDDSVQHSPQAETSSPIRPVATSESFTIIRGISSPFSLATTNPSDPYSSSGIIPTTRRISTDESSVSTESDWINQPFSLTQVASASEARNNSPPDVSTLIHPPSEGGSVTWNDHNDLVFRQGKDRGPRVPAPPLPEGYKSNGPLKDFPFDKLRGNNERKAPIKQFQDEYFGKQDQTPTRLVSQIVAYYEGNEDEKLKYLMEKNVKIQGLNEQIRVQEREYNAIREELAENRAVGNFSAERGRKIEEQTQELKNKEQLIANLRRRIAELENGDTTGHGREDDQLIETLMLRIVELEEAARNQKAQSSRDAQDSDGANQEEKINNLVKDLENRDKAIDELISQIKELKLAHTQQQEQQQRQSAKYPESDRAEHERTIQEFEQKIKARERTISDLTNTIHQQQEADRVLREAAGKIPVPRVKEKIKTATQIRASMLELNVRVLLLKAQRYLDSREYSAAGKETMRAEAIVRKHLSHLKVLRGRVAYVHGRTMYELGFFVEAMQDLKKALKMGYDAHCQEVDGDCVQPLLEKARSAHGQEVRSGYPEHTLGPDES